MSEYIRNPILGSSCRVPGYYVPRCGIRSREVGSSLIMRRNSGPENDESGLCRADPLFVRRRISLYVGNYCSSWRRQRTGHGSRYTTMSIDQPRQKGCWKMFQLGISTSIFQQVMRFRGSCQIHVERSAKSG